MIPRVPTVFGHEFAGTVAAVGAGVRGVREGDRAVGANSAPCRACPLCRAGRPNLCEDLLFVNGAYGEFIALPPRLVSENVVPLAAALPAARAAFAEPLACALLAIQRARVEAGQTVAVLGHGPLGCLLGMLAMSRGARVVMVGKAGWRFDRLKHLGFARWLDAIGDFEALGDLAGYAFEHPADPFPEVADSGATFHARALGHPLLLDSLCVRNALELSGAHPLVVVSGSNMSGKSTFLRSVGTAAVMALAGAPVRAEGLALSPLALGACLRVQDSLRDGASRFYAELLSLRRVAERCKGPLPVLFLLDEILNGTNSHDRRIGADALLKGLIARGAIGLVTTHDLALTAIADELAPRASNAHFEDQLENGALRFDYRLRPGVISRGNALELMRAVGLDLSDLH
jgi:threonine dehydrogenase-like Zn-dependent dehydrogenase